MTSCYSRNLFLAGVGSGKSHCAGYVSADFILNYPHVRGFIGANTYKQLSKSTLDKVFKVWGSEFGWKRNKNYVVNKTPPKDWIKYGEQLESYDGVISFDNGAVLFTAALENYTAIDGTEFCWGILDETKDTKEEAVKEVIIARMRQPGIYVNPNGSLTTKPTNEAFNPLYIFTSPAKVDWINEWFEISDQTTIEEIHRRIFSKTDYYKHVKNGKKVVISSTYHNEHNLAQGFIDNLKRDFGNNQNRINMLIYASPVAKTGGEYVSEFEREQHIKPVEFNPNFAVHATFDFNVVPYCTLLLFHVVNIGGKYQLQFFDELCFESPKNNTEALCEAAKQKYIERARHVFYTGDASGKNRTTVSTEHNFQVIERVFRKYLSPSSDRRQRRNPGLIKSRDFINKLFAGNVRNVLPPVIDPRCKNLIRDLEFLKEAPDGGYLIQHAKDENGGQYEKYGHCYDAFKYGAISTFASIYEAE